MARNSSSMRSILLAVFCVAVGCMIGFQIWIETVWGVYYRKMNPQDPPFESFGELTRGIAIVLGGIAGFFVKEFLMYFVRKSHPVDAS